MPMIKLECQNWQVGEVHHVTRLEPIYRSGQPPMYRLNHIAFTIDRSIDDLSKQSALVAQSDAIHADLAEARKEFAWIREHPPVSAIASLRERNDP